MKKLLSVLFAFVLLTSAVLPAVAVGDPLADPPANAVCENDYWYVIEQTEDGPVFSYLRYIENDDDDDRNALYIPKTLGGVTLTPENFNGSVFYPFYFGWWYIPFEVDEDNEFFSVIDGTLYSKDGKTLVCYPPGEPDQVIHQIPEGTRTFAKGPVCDHCRWIECIRFPDSVTEIPAEAFPEYDGMIAARSGGAAQQFAEDRGLQFLSLDAGHTHVYFRDSYIDRDAEAYVVSLVCPCGDVLESESTPFGWDDDSPDDCACMCHQTRSIFSIISDPSPKAVLQKLWYYIRRMVWQLTGTHQYCACGARHW